MVNISEASKPMEKMLKLIRLCPFIIILCKHHNNILLITMRYYFIPISLVQSSLAAQNVGKCMEE